MVPLVQHSEITVLTSWILLHMLDEYWLPLIAAASTAAASARATTMEATIKFIVYRLRLVLSYL
jgi:hypothetical protein